MFSAAVHRQSLTTKGLLDSVLTPSVNAEGRSLGGIEVPDANNWTLIQFIIW